MTEQESKSIIGRQVGVFSDSIKRGRKERKKERIPSLFSVGSSVEEVEHSTKQLW